MKSSPLKIAFMPIGGYDWPGGWYFLQNLYLSLRKYREHTQFPFELIFLTDRDMEKDIGNTIKQEFDRIIPVTIQKHHLIDRLRRKLAHRKGNFYYAHWRRAILKNNIDIVFPTSLTGESFQSCYWVPDLIQMNPVTWIPEKEIHHRQQVFGMECSKAQRVMVNSQATAKDFAKHFPEHQHKVSVINFRCVVDAKLLQKDPHEIRKQYHLPDRYFIACNQFWKSKNHPVIFQALKHLKDQGIHVHVVCTGSFHDPYNLTYRDQILSMIHTLGIANQVSIMGFIPKDHMFQLMRASAGVIQSSFFEGWNGSLEEAAHLGKPAMLTDIPVHHEKKCLETHFYDPYQPEQLAQLMRTLWLVEGSGFDREKEQIACKNYHQLIMEYAEQFLTMFGVSVPLNNDEKGTCRKVE